MEVAGEEFRADEPTMGERIGEVGTNAGGDGVEGVALGDAAIGDEQQVGHGGSAAGSDIGVEEVGSLDASRRA